MGVSVSIEHDRRPVRAGERVEATVVVASSRERDVDAITLELVGKAHVWRSESTEMVPVLTLAKELAGATHLMPGERRFRATFELPSDIPPSAAAGDLSIDYELRARVEIAWHIDPRAARPVTVLPPLPAPRGEPRRITVSSEARAGEPFLELTLDDPRWAPGETITGAFSIGNVAARRLDGATVAVVRLNDAMALAIPGGCSVFKSLVGLGEGSVIRFALPLPEDTLPSFECRIGRVIRAVVLRVDGSSAECVIPIAVDAFEPRAGALAETDEPVGGARWRQGWREEGERLGLSLARGELELLGELAGATRVKVRPKGHGLAATLRWESLGIGLSSERRGLLSTAGVDLHAVCPAFTDRYVVRGFDERQVRAALDQELCSRLAGFDQVKLDDRGVKLGREVSARDPAALRLFLGAVDGLAHAVVSAAARIPPPVWVDAEAAAAWRAFAEATMGKLYVGSMSVRGAIFDGDRVHVETLLDAEGRPEATRVVLVLDPAVDVREPPVLPEALKLAAQKLEGPVVDHKRPALWPFAVAPDAITIALHAFVRDPAALRPVVAEMQRLAARLRGETSRGPYR